MDLGEFSQFRTWLQIGVPIASVLTMSFIDEFLAVRALGMMALLSAEPVLSAAFSVRKCRVCCLSFWHIYGLPLDFFGSACPMFARSDRLDHQKRKPVQGVNIDRTGLRAGGPGLRGNGVLVAGGW